MKQSCLVTSIVALAVLGGGPVKADSLEMREIKASHESGYSRSVQRLNDSCRADIRATIDWAGAQDPDIKKSRYTGPCLDIVSGLDIVCGHPGGREAVARQVRNLVCTFGSARSLKLTGDTLTYTATFQPVRASEIVAWLESNLSATGGAEPLAIRQAKAQPEKMLADATGVLNRLCKSNVATRIDWTGVPDEAWTDNPYPRSNCSSALSSVSGLCEDPVAAQAVRQQIRTIACSYGQAPAVALKDGTLNYTMQFKSYTDTTIVSDYLDNNLFVDRPDGDTLKVRRIKARQEASVVKDVAEVNRYCDSHISVSFDWSALPTEWSSSQDELRWKPERYCSRVLGAIRSMCMGDAARGEISRRINSIVCGFGARRSMDLKDGTLHYRISPKSDDDYEFVQTYLRQNL